VYATADERIGDGRLHRELMARALQPTATPEDRESVIAELIALAGDRPEPLERVRLEFHRRLTHRRDDFDATGGLRLVEGALGMVSRPDGEWRRQIRERRRRRRP